MVGCLIFGDKGGVQRREVLGCGFAVATVRPGRGEATTVRRIRRAARRLRRLGVREVVTAAGFAYGEALAAEGLGVVSTRPLREELAADWARQLLAGRNGPLSEQRVAVTAAELTPRVAAAVRTLCLRHRYVALRVPRGGEELGRQLYREYGVSLQRSAGVGALTIQFDPTPETAEVRTWDESVPLPPLRLGPGKREALAKAVEGWGEGLDRAQLLSALHGDGVLGTPGVGEPLDFSGEGRNAD